jgi:subtilase family serine protease
MRALGTFSSYECLRHLLAVVFILPLAVTAQSPPSSLVTRPIDESQTVTLRGTVHPLTRAGSDQGAVPDSFAANRMLLMLNRPPERETALRQFLAEVHNPGSATYHKWVTPEQFGELFGPSDSDIQTAVGWLASHGFRVARVTKSKSLIEFSGTAANVREAFHSEIHQYSVNEETHFANDRDLAIPEALAPLVRGVSPINNFYPQSYLHTLGSASYSRSTGKATPLFTNPDGRTEFFAVAPEDFATQYDLGPLYSAGTNGMGQTIGILNRSNIDVSLANAYRSLFNLSANPPQIVIDGDDPGEIADRVEAYLDVELSGAVAPNATVNLYIADGGNVQDPLVLAALRAIEDNQASVLSASYGECEQQLGDAGNQLWAGLWEQAAAQGQTVFVSSGDSGPATCPLTGSISNGVITVTGPGLSVNGLASTPWNVAVGGTDFFYADYATGAPSAPTLWNQTNDASLGSLKAPLPEQPWDDALGLNATAYIAPVLEFTIPSAAGGGSVSNCSQSMVTPPAVPACVAGYPKPSWQNAPGVPSDSARDLPDVSLFAANGKNFSSSPICAQPGDCASGAGAQSTVYLVGGTSASSPAMAGIMALVNQKYGRQGQANFALYALARQQPSVFHDITVGTNDILCVSGTTDCNTPLQNSLLTDLMSYGVYAAGPGYDEASGLGSVDANALVTNWDKITFLPTTTTLALSPASIVHGTPVTFTAKVSGSPGSGTPTGDVSISANSLLPLQKSGAVAVVGGTASESVNFFPGGSYEVAADYAGDGVFAPSISTPVRLTVTPEPSVVTPIVAYSYIDYSTGIGHSGDAQNSQQIPFGSLWTLEAEPSGANSGTSGLATGTATFTDGSTSTQVSTNSAGIAAVSIPSLAVGQHSVSVSYSGDASFNASTGGPLAFTVVPGNPRILLTSDIVQISVNGNPVPIPAGTNFTVGILIGTTRGIAPTGSVSVTLGTATQTVPLAPFLEGGTVLASAQVTFTNLRPGSFALSASYPGDANWNSATDAYPVPISVASVTLVPTTTTLTATPASLNSQGSVTLVATVQAGAGAQGPPDGPVFFYVDGATLSLAILESSSPSATTATATVVVPSTELPNGIDQITAGFPGFPAFPGITGVAPSTSAPVVVTVTPSDFRMFFAGSQIDVDSGQTGSASLNLNAANGSAVSVALSCVTSSPSFTCGVNPSTPMVSGATTVAVTINAFVLSGAANLPPQGNRPLQLPVDIVAAIALVLLFVLLRAPRRTSAKLRWVFATCVLSLLLLISGCGGGGGSSAIAPPPPPANIPTPAGTYSVLVSATANGIVRNAKLIVVVQ